MTKQFSEIVTQVLAENQASLAKIEDAKIDMFLQSLRNAPHIFCTGEGRSGLVMRMFAMRLTHLGLRAFVVGDATTPSIQRDDLLVVCSGSGETAIPCLRAERVRQMGGTVIVLCGSANSRLANMVQLTIFLSPPAIDQSQQRRTVQFGGSRFEQSVLLFCDILAYLAMERWGIDPSEMQSRHANLE